MTMQLSVAVRNAQLDAFESVAGVAAKLQILTGAPPANCAASDPGTVLVEMTLPSNWMADAASGVKAKAGTWNGTAAAIGTAGHYRFLDSAGTTCHQQGTVTLTGGGGDMTIDNTSVSTGQTVTVTAFTQTAGNA